MAAGTTGLVIDVASGATNSFANLSFAAFAGGDAFDDGADTITINGDAGNETITGTSLADTINGNAGNDAVTGGAGNDTFDGGANTDTATYTGTVTSIASNGSGGWTVNAGAEGTDTLSNVEVVDDAAPGRTSCWLAMAAMPPSRTRSMPRRRATPFWSGPEPTPATSPSARMA